jgi:hypothetical protein
LQQELRKFPISIHKEALFACLDDFCQIYEEWEREEASRYQIITTAKGEVYRLDNKNGYSTFHFTRGYVSVS